MQLANLVQRIALRQPNKTATIYGGRRQTWSQLMRRVSRFAGALNKMDINSGERLVYGDSPASPHLRDRVEQALPGIELYQAYGMTEMGPLVTILRPEDHEENTGTSQRYRSVGRPMVGVELKIVDGKFRELPAGTIGRIIASISFRSEPLPLTAPGKVLKRELRRTYPIY